MRNIITILLIAIGASCSAQKKITALTNSFQISTQTFPLGGVSMNIPNNYFVGFQSTNTGHVVFALDSIKHYKRATGVAFTDSAHMVAFYDSFMAGTLSPGIAASGDLSGYYPAPLIRPTAAHGRLIGSSASTNTISDIKVANNLAMAHDTLSFLPAVKAQTGSGTPLFVISAPVGSLYLRTNGVVDSTLYIKFTGTDSAGWYPLKH